MTRPVRGPDDSLDLASVLDGGTDLTRPAWDAFQAAQAAMDAAADRLNVVCEVIIDVLR